MTLPTLTEAEACKQYAEHAAGCLESRGVEAASTRAIAQCPPGMPGDLDGATAEAELSQVA